MTDNRRRDWTCTIYPDSMPKNLIDILTHLFVPCILSPLHDRDVNPDGKPKKPHFHFMVCFDGPKTYRQAEAVFACVHGVVPPGEQAEVKSVRSLARYFCLLDNPEKFQYNVNDVRAFGGLDYTAIIGSASDKYKAIREMLQFCNDYKVFSYSELLEYAGQYRSDWFRMLCDSCTMVMKEYLKSKFWFEYDKAVPKRKEPLPVPVGAETGEVKIVE